MNSQTKAIFAGSAALVAALGAVPAMAYDPYDRAHGFGQRDPEARDAVSMCADAAERRVSYRAPARVDRITNVDRRRNGFLVSGRLKVQDRWGHGRGRDAWFRCHTRHGRMIGLDVKFC